MDPSATLTLDGLDVSYDQLIRYQRGHVIGKRLLIGCIALLLYSHILTVQEEWTFVWSRRPWCVLPKALFVIIRHFSLFDLLIYWISLEHNICLLGQISGWITIIIFAAVDLVLILRVWVLYNLSRVFALVIMAGYLSYLAAALTIRAYQPKLPLPFVEKPPMSLTTCPQPEPQQYFLQAIIGLVAQTVTFVFLLRKLWKDKMLSTLYTSHVLFTHAIIYIAIISTMLILSMISSIVPQLYVPVTESNVVMTLSSLTCSQLVLSLKRSYQYNGETLPASKGEEGGPCLFLHGLSSPSCQYLDRFVGAGAQLGPIRPYPFR